MSGDIWTRDEYLVTLDLYLNDPDVVADKQDPTVEEAARLIGRTPDAVAMRLANYRHLDPQSTQGLSHVNQDCQQIWEEYYRHEEELAREAEQARARLRESDDTAERDPPGSDTRVDTDETSSEGATRIGQNDFRSVIRSRYQDQCLLCDVSNPGLLQAGHILGWSEFEAARGDPGNGLLLCYTHHRAFDLGMFTLSKDYEVVLSPDFAPEGDFLQRTLTDGSDLDFPGEPPSQEYLRRHNERLPWWPPENEE
jgi:putative restriction endonuclease